MGAPSPALRPREDDRRQGVRQRKMAGALICPCAQGTENQAFFTVGLAWLDLSLCKAGLIRESRCARAARRCGQAPDGGASWPRCRRVMRALRSHQTPWPPLCPARSRRRKKRVFRKWKQQSRFSDTRAKSERVGPWCPPALCAAPAPPPIARKAPASPMVNKHSQLRSKPCQKADLTPCRRLSPYDAPD